MKKTFFIITAGCLRRKLDSQRHENLFEKNGWKSESRPENADLIVLSSCNFSNDQEETSIMMLKDILKKIKKGSKLIVTGCTAGFRETLFKKGINSEDIDIITSEEEFDLIIEKRKCLEQIPDCNEFKVRRLSFAFSMKSLFNPVSVWRKYRKLWCIKSFINHNFFPKKYFYLRLGNGCLGNCSYCIIKRSIGSLKSKPVDVIIDEFKMGIKSGYSEFILLGDDTGAYGRDIGATLTELIDKITSYEGRYKLHIIELNINWFVKMREEFSMLINRGKIKGIHFCLQSGSENILKLMNRYSDINKIRESLINLNRDFPDLRKSVDLIQGFPGETEKDFEETTDLIKKSGFKDVWLFPYSERSQTPACSLPGKVKNEVIHDRIKRFYKIVRCNNLYFPFYR